MTKYRVCVNCEIELIADLDNENVDSDTLLLNSGDEVEFEVMDYGYRFDGNDFVEDKSIINIRFVDGSLGQGLSQDWFEEIK